MHSVHPGELVELFSVASGDPAAALDGAPLVVVDAAVGGPPAGWGPGSVPVVVIGVVDDDPAGVVDAGPYDVVLAADDPMLAAVIANVTAFPIAAAALAILLRESERRPVEDGLAAESAVYSTLQSGPEFTAWRRARGGTGLAPDEEPPVLADRVGDELHVVLNRPRRHNAVTAALRDGLAEALTLAAVDDSITAVRLSGNGPSFCSGGDLGEFGSFPDPATAHITRLTRSPARLAHLLADRLHVRLHGACMGAGIEVPAFAAHVTAAADSRIAPARAGPRARAGRRRDGQHPPPHRSPPCRCARPQRCRHRRRHGTGVGPGGRGRLTWWQADHVVDPAELRALGWDDALEEEWQDLGAPGSPGRISRLDRGWSTVLTGADPADPANVRRVRNIGADVAVGDWVIPSDDGERVDHVMPRRSAFVRRASFEGSRAEADTLAANIDVVFLTHSFGHAAQPAPPRARAGAGLRQRRRAGGRADQGRPRR